MRQPALETTEGDPRKPFILIGLSYLGLVGLALYVDYKIQMRRARKRREAREKKEDPRR